MEFPNSFAPHNIEDQVGPSGVDSQTVQELKEYIDRQIQLHRHNGVSGQLVELDKEIGGLFETVSSVPTHTPSGVWDQIKVYNSSGTKRLYWYDVTNKTWTFATGT